MTTIYQIDFFLWTHGTEKLPVTTQWGDELKSSETADIRMTPNS
jgi:hypothetical protein